MRTCKGCGNEFEHVIKGRGRPPAYCMDCKADKEKPATKELPKTEPRITYKGSPSVGDEAIRPAFHMFEDTSAAIRNATRVKVVSIDGDVAYVRHPSEKYPISTDYSKLLKVNYVY